LVGILYYIRRLKLAGEEHEKLRDSALETKKGRSAIAVAAQITTRTEDSQNAKLGHCAEVGTDKRAVPSEQTRIRAD
jgi:hypothetical protein